MSEKVLSKIFKDEDKYLSSREYAIIAGSLEEHRSKERAIELLEEGVKNFPHAHLLWFRLGLTLVKLHKYDEAIPALEKAKELEPTNEKYINFLNRIKTGTVHSDILNKKATFGIYTEKSQQLKSAGHYSDAILLLEEATDNFPKDYLLLNQLGNALSLAHRHDEALAVFDSSLEINSNDESTQRQFRMAKNRAQQTPDKGNLSGQDWAYRI